jgi:hypothetical protein
MYEASFFFKSSDLVRMHLDRHAFTAESEAEMRACVYAFMRGGLFKFPAFIHDVAFFRSYNLQVV